MKLIAAGLLIALAACANPGAPTAAPTGITSSNGGSMRPLNIPLNSTAVP